MKVTGSEETPIDVEKGQSLDIQLTVGGISSEYIKVKVTFMDPEGKDVTSLSSLKPDTVSHTVTASLNIDYEKVVDGKYTCVVSVNGGKVKELIRTVTQKGWLFFLYIIV